MAVRSRYVGWSSCRYMTPAIRCQKIFEDGKLFMSSGSTHTAFEQQQRPKAVMSVQPTKESDALRPYVHGQIGAS